MAYYREERIKSNVTTPQREHNQAKIEGKEKKESLFQIAKHDVAQSSVDGASRTTPHTTTQLSQNDTSSVAASSPRKPRKKVPSKKAVENKEINNIEEENTIDQHKGVVEIQKTTTRRADVSKTRKSSKRGKCSVATDQVKVAIDPVIEQWYTDPHNRYDPEGPANDVLRRRVLTTTLRNRGFRGYRVHAIVNWLLRCKGMHRRYEDRTKKKRQRRRMDKRDTPSTRKSNYNMQEELEITASCLSPTTTRVNLTQDISNADSDVSNTSNRRASSRSTPVDITATHDDGKADRDDRIPHTVARSPGESIFGEVEDEYHNDFDEDDDYEQGERKDTNPLQTEAEEAAVMHQLKEEITGQRPSFFSIHALGTEQHQDDYNDWCLEEIKRTLAFWKIIYGEDLTNSQEQGGAEIGFTYFRDPNGLPTPDILYRSQGLQPAKHVIFEGREALTEDETFGLYVPSKKEQIKKTDSDKPT